MSGTTAEQVLKDHEAQIVALTPEDTAGVDRFTPSRVGGIDGLEAAELDRVFATIVTEGPMQAGSCDDYIRGSTGVRYFDHQGSDLEDEAQSRVLQDAVQIRDAIRRLASRNSHVAESYVERVTHDYGVFAGANVVLVRFDWFIRFCVR